MKIFHKTPFFSRPSPKTTPQAVSNEALFRVTLRPGPIEGELVPTTCGEGIGTQDDVVDNLFLREPPSVVIRSVLRSVQLLHNDEFDEPQIVVRKGVLSNGH